MASSNRPESREVAELYDAAPQREWERLEGRKVEFGVTCRVLMEHLPPPPARTLDVGAGPGRYGMFLAELGYSVSMVDISAECLAFAEEEALRHGLVLDVVRQADARDLSGFPDGEMDAVLLLGPLYHLKSENDRIAAVQEVLRVLRQGGLMFAAFLNRYSVVRYAAKVRPSQLWNDPGLIDSILNTGVGESAHPDAKFLRTCYFADPLEVRPFMEGMSLVTLDLVGCEGVVAETEDALNALPESELDLWIDLNLRLGRREELHAASAHLLYVGRKA